MMEPDDLNSAMHSLPSDIKSRSASALVEDYRTLIGDEALDRLLRKAHALCELHLVNVSSTYYGGGVAAMLSSLTLLMNGAGLRTGWRIIQGRPDFFSVTKRMHNALQGADINLTALKMQIYEEVAAENALRNHLDHDLVIVHDPQPLPLVRHYRKKAPWIWRCHLDLSSPNACMWSYLTPMIEAYDAVVLSLPEYAQKLSVPQRFILPAIDPFSTTNREMTDEEIEERLAHYRIPTDLPLIVQVSRFDRWKDPDGVIEAFRIVRRQVDCTLVLVGNVATDDPEGQEVFAGLCGKAEDRIIVLSVQDSALVNALQRRATVILQKSLREGFGLTVTEAMWKGAAVIGGRVGGIKRQIRDGENGFLVDSVEQAAERMLLLLRDQDLRQQIGEKARETVREDFLMTRLMEDWLDLIGSFEVSFRLRRA